jgi:hypothetical protein
MVEQPRDERGQFASRRPRIYRTQQEEAEAWEREQKAAFLSQVLGGEDPENPLGYQEFPLDALFPERRKGQQQ